MTASLVRLDNAGARLRRPRISLRRTSVLNRRQTSADDDEHNDVVAIRYLVPPNTACPPPKWTADGVVSDYTEQDDSLTTITYTDDKDLTPGATRWYRVVRHQRG